MADTTTTASATTNPSTTTTTSTVKPGAATSELWLSVAAGIAITILTALQEHSDVLPPIAKAAVALIAPIALAWLSQAYSHSRATVKAAASAAGATASAAVTDSASAAAVLRGGT